MENAELEVLEITRQMLEAMYTGTLKYIANTVRRICRLMNGTSRPSALMVWSFT